MSYSNRFLSALGAWHRGWREDGARRMQIKSGPRNWIAGCGNMDEERSRRFTAKNIQ
jgi:hypothetical protein